jgi:hypothetical protein
MTSDNTAPPINLRVPSPLSMMPSSERHQGMILGTLGMRIFGCTAEPAIRLGKCSNQATGIVNP